jgi:hypothetical protein
MPRLAPPPPIPHTFPNLSVPSLFFSPLENTKGRCVLVVWGGERSSEDLIIFFPFFKNKNQFNCLAKWPPDSIACSICSRVSVLDPLLPPSIVRSTSLTLRLCSLSWLHACHPADCRYTDWRDSENSSLRSPKFAQQGTLSSLSSCLSHPCTPSPLPLPIYLQSQRRCV